MLICLHSIYQECFTKSVLLVFCRKDLYEARVKPKVSSYFQMKCTAQVYPQWWHLVAKSRIRSFSDDVYRVFR